MDARQGDLATKEGLKAVKSELKQDIQLVKKDISSLDKRIDTVWRVMLAGFTVLFTGLLTTMLYLHSDTGKRMDRIESKLDQALQQKR